MLRQARIPSREALSRVLARLRHAGALLRRDGFASLRADARLLADLLRRGGILLVIADAAGAPAARILIQPDADILMTVDRRCLGDPALVTRLQDEQRAISSRIASATRPVDAIWTVVHGIAAAIYLSVAGQAAVRLEHLLARTAAAAGVVLLGMLASSALRRFLLHWLLRRL